MNSVTNFGDNSAPSSSSKPVLRSALAYTRQGWRVIPVPHRSKNPGLKNWQRLRLTEEQLPEYFKDEPQNIGVLLGEPSNWIVDVDLDHPHAIRLADQYLPPTDAVFGRAGKPRSHRLYRVTSPCSTNKFKSKRAGTIVEIRSSGAQTIFPPSTHESGEPIRWDRDNPIVQDVEPQQLTKSVQELYDAVLIKLSEAPSPQTTQSKTRAKSTGHRQDTSAFQDDLGVDARLSWCLEAMLRLQMVDHQDGSSRLYACACRCIEHDLTDDQAVRCIRQYAQLRPFPGNWSDDQIRHRLRDAEKVCDRGAAFQTDPNGFVELGHYDPKSGRLVLSPNRTLPTAQAFVREHFMIGQHVTLRHYAGLFTNWNGSHYVEIEQAKIRGILYPWLHRALRYNFNQSSKTMELIPFDANTRTVNHAIDAVKGDCYLRASITPPAWLSEQDHRPPAIEILPCKSTLLHLPSMANIGPTPDLFVTNALAFNPDPKATRPEQWLRFLDQLWGDDLESRQLLQEWFGYSLTGDTSQQKMLLIVGPRRSGKGTLARVLRQLVGPGNVVGPTTSGLAGDFGLQPLIGKTLAIVSDARFSGPKLATVVERLLCISGEDALTIDRKYLPSITMKLPTRFIFLTNELPRLSDSSGALVGRFNILQLERSFYGEEDPHLIDKLTAELPGVLNWAIKGWTRLDSRGHFVQPASVEDAVQQLEELGSPVKAFVRERCVVGPGHRVDCQRLYEAWSCWCLSEGRHLVTTNATFGRDLMAAVPGLRRRRRRNPDDSTFYEGIDLNPNDPMDTLI